MYRLINTGDDYNHGIAESDSKEDLIQWEILECNKKLNRYKDLLRNKNNFNEPYHIPFRRYLLEILSSYPDFENEILHISYSNKDGNENMEVKFLGFVGNFSIIEV